MSSYIVFNKDNCYVCNSALGPCRNLLVSYTNFTETPIYDILESFTGARISRKVRNESSICQECFLTIEKYDELQFQSEEIQNNLTLLYVKTHSEQVYIKQEPIVQLETESEVRIECKKCGEMFPNLRSMAYHSHEREYRPAHRRSYYKSENSGIISNNFKENAIRHGVDYNYSLFQKTFFSENEKESFAKPRRPRGEIARPKTPESLDDKISDDFKLLAKKSGIDYNIEAFQRAFGYSELETQSKNAAKNAMKRENTKEKSRNDSSSPEQKKKKLTVNKRFVDVLQANGIKYDLKAFQKAFGYSETIEAEVKYDEERSKEFKELKMKGFVDCARCDLRFTNRNSFLQHMKVHKPKDPDLFCEDCKKHFKTKACLQIHLATDHGRNNGPVDCPICFKSYQDRSALRSHYYIHTSERSFLCGRCGATFLHKKSFEMHQLMHDDIRPFACSYPGCPKRFRNTAKLKIHLRVHSGEKIYECPHCPGKRFAQKWGMDLHIKKQHKNEIVPNEICKICGIQIQTKAKMRLHLANVHQVAGQMILETEGY